MLAILVFHYITSQPFHRHLELWRIFIQHSHFADRWMVSNNVERYDTKFAYNDTLWSLDLSKHYRQLLWWMYHSFHFKSLLCQHCLEEMDRGFGWQHCGIMYDMYPSIFPYSFFGISPAMCAWLSFGCMNSAICNQKPTQYANLCCKERHDHRQILPPQSNAHIHISHSLLNHQCFEYYYCLLFHNHKHRVWSTSSASHLLHWNSPEWKNTIYNLRW